MILRKREYCKLKETALDRTLWRTRFGRGCGPVVRQATEWMTGSVQNLESRQVASIEVSSIVPQGRRTSDFYERYSKPVVWTLSFFYRRLFVRLPHFLWSIGWLTYSYWITDWLTDWLDLFIYLFTYLRLRRLC